MTFPVSKEEICGHPYQSAHREKPDRLSEKWSYSGSFYWVAYVELPAFFHFIFYNLYFILFQENKKFLQGLLCCFLQVGLSGTNIFSWMVMSLFQTL